MIVKKDLLSINDVSKKEVLALYKLSAKLKKKPLNQSLRQKTLAMIFAKPSTRTRVSFETGMTQLGGHAIYLGMNDLQLGRGETVSDTARTLSRYVDGIMARLYAHSDIVSLGEAAGVPVINGLTDLEHPCQALSDLFTVWEKKKKLDGLRLAFQGDGNNNITHSLMLLCPLLGVSITVASPREYAPLPEVVAKAKHYAGVTGAEVKVTNSPEGAAAGADVVYTDTFVSMGRTDVEERLKALMPFQVSSKTMRSAAKGAIFMHDLPAYRGKEVEAGVIDGPQSVVWDQAENRLHVQKAVMATLMR